MKQDSDTPKMTLRNSIQSIKWAMPALALLGATAGCQHQEEIQRPDRSPRVVAAKVLTVESFASSWRFEAVGTVKSLFNASLSSRVMGRVESIAVREGDTIHQGQLLISIDSRDLQSAVNMARANYQAAVLGVESAKTSASLEYQASQSKIVQAMAQVEQAKAGLAASEARRDLVVAGTRAQEVAQSHIAVVEAESNLHLSKLELERTSRLVRDGALAQRELDIAQNQYDLAKGSYDRAVQAESSAREGSRSQEVRAAQDAVAQARAVLRQANSGLALAKADALQVDVRRKAVEVAVSQAQQSAAALDSARVGLSDSRILAPFDGRVSARRADPGTMATPGVPLLEVEGGAYRLEAIVPESLVTSISRGQALDVQIDALAEKAIRGTVDEIVPQGDSASHSFIVKVSLSPIPGVKAGMFGRVALPTPVAKRILIPASATWVREGLHYVYALNGDGIARLRMITLGEETADKVEVLSGLSQGDRIVGGERSQVSDGVRVEGGQS